MSQNPPTWSRSFIPDSDDEFVDDEYGKRELERMDYGDLQSIAADHPSEDVHGRMSEDDLVEGLTGKKRL